MVSGQLGGGDVGGIQIGRTMRSECRIAVGGAADLVPSAGGLFQQGLGDVGGQGVLGGEVQVEAAVGQAGLLHHSIHADTVDAVLTEQVAGGGQDALAGFSASAG